MILWDHRCFFADFNAGGRTVKGKVWLVGAGPGDPGLFTIKGREVLQQADVVVYDALISQEILDLIPGQTRRIFAGKRSGHHFLPQEETNRVLLDEALAGNNVVRLKGGDPFLFGRGGEELELLAENGVPFEVVPGVTSAFAVPAYNGIPVTHRDYCSSVHIVTGHRRKDRSIDIDFEALVRTKGTLIFLMGIAALADLCSGLLRAGMDPDMPAAVLEKGTTKEQRRIAATVGTLETACKEACVQTPAILIVGKVCELADTFSWFETAEKEQ
ncbi:MAG: uroporphyrinogen-III C-methyltransferase [Firmicutes bacterium]|nr:uroporphyrinogen-III C-methyltransferase [Bacillota bacterium]